MTKSKGLTKEVFKQLVRFWVSIRNRKRDSHKKGAHFGSPRKFFKIFLIFPYEKQFHGDNLFYFIENLLMIVALSSHVTDFP